MGTTPHARPVRGGLDRRSSLRTCGPRYRRVRRASAESSRLGKRRTGARRYPAKTDSRKKRSTSGPSRAAATPARGARRPHRTPPPEWWRAAPIGRRAQFLVSHPPQGATPRRSRRCRARFGARGQSLAQDAFLLWRVADVARYPASTPATSRASRRANLEPQQKETRCRDPAPRDRIPATAGG